MDEKNQPREIKLSENAQKWRTFDTQKLQAIA